MRLLVLHGYRQNKDLIKRSSATLEEKAKKRGITFEYLDAPFLLSEDEPGFEAGIQRRKWYSIDREDILTDRTTKYDTVAESLEYVANIFNKGSYDGIIAFSQGSILLQILLSTSMINPKGYFIFISTFFVGDPRFLPISLPEKGKYLLVVGERDTLVPIDKTLSVFNKTYPVVKHEGGHYVPSRSAAVKSILEFLTS